MPVPAALRGDDLGRCQTVAARTSQCQHAREIELLPIGGLQPSDAGGVVGVQAALPGRRGVGPNQCQLGRGAGAGDGVGQGVLEAGQ